MQIDSIIQEFLTKHKDQIITQNYRFLFGQAEVSLTPSQTLQLCEILIKANIFFPNQISFNNNDVKQNLAKLSNKELYNLGSYIMAGDIDYIIDKSHDLYFIVNVSTYMTKENFINLLYNHLIASIINGRGLPWHAFYRSGIPCLNDPVVRKAFLSINSHNFDILSELAEVKTLDKSQIDL